MSRFFEAGFYDFDGCNVDSGPYNNKLMVLGLEAQQQMRAEETLRQARGYPWKECVRHLFPDAPKEVIDQYYEDVLTCQYQLIDELEVFPYVTETLYSHRLQEIPLAIVSNRGSSIYWMLREKGLYGFYDVFVDRGMVNNPKPHPEPYWLAAKLLGGVDLGRCFSVGDSKTDIISSKAAGVGLTIGFAPGYDGGDELLKADPDHIVHSYKTIDYIVTNGIKRTSGEPTIWQNF